MATQCSVCGRELSLRNSFYYDDKPICRDCLRTIEQKREKERSEPVKKPRRKGLGSRIFWLIMTMAFMGIGIGVYATGGAMAIRFVNIKLSPMAFVLILSVIIMLQIIGIIGFFQKKEE